MKTVIPGINIQYPISRLIVDGKKTIETRTYPLPKHYIGRPMALIETPGRNSKLTAKVTAIIVFGASFKYSDKKSFYEDQNKHFVSPKSPWAWKNDKPKWGWPLIKILKLPKPLPAPSKRGIKFSKSVTVNL